MKHQHSLLALVLLAGVVPAWGDTDIDTPAHAEAAAAEPEAMLGEVTMSDEQLDRLRGRQTVFNSNDVDGQLYNNDAIANVTGSNFVTDGSFTNMSGFSTVIQNSGNNVLIQNATVLNLQIQQ